MGWNGSNTEAERATKATSSSAKASRATTPSALKGLWAGLLVIAAGLTAWVFLRVDPPKAPKEPVPEAKSSRIAEVAPEIAAPSPVEVVKEKTVDPEKIKEVKRLQALSKEEREEIAYQKLKEKPLDLTPKTNRIFRTGTEASLARIFMTRVGDPPPPFFTTKIPLRDEAHLAEILIADNPALETDSDAQRETKEMVELAKKEMIQFIRDGGAPEEFLEYYHGKLQEAHMVRSEAMKTFMSVAREDPTIASDYLERLNESLNEKGIRAIELSEKQKQRFGIED